MGTTPAKTARKFQGAPSEVSWSNARTFPDTVLPHAAGVSRLCLRLRQPSPPGARAGSPSRGSDVWASYVMARRFPAP
jgi:hypothetical protein